MMHSGLPLTTPLKHGASLRCSACGKGIMNGERSVSVKLWYRTQHKFMPLSLWPVFAGTKAILWIQSTMKMPLRCVQLQLRKPMQSPRTRLVMMLWQRLNWGVQLHYTVQLVHAAKDRYADQAMPWALLTMLFDASCSPDTRATEVRNAQFKAQTIATSKSNAASTLQSAPFLELEVLLLDMHLGSLALKTHVFAQRQPDNEKFKLQLALCKAQGTALEGELDTAVNMLKTAVRSTGAGSVYMNSRGSGGFGALVAIFTGFSCSWK